MKEWVHNIERIVDKLIPLLLIILLLIIVLEFAYHEKAQKYYLHIEIIDYFIIFVFLIDLAFKYNRIKNMKIFLKESWIEIIAVFPFFLVFRLFEGLLGLLGISETTAQAQKIAHVGVEIEKEIGSRLKEGARIAEETAKISRAERLSRFIRPIARSIRFFKLKDKHIRKEAKEELKEGEEFVKAAIFYEKPGISHHHLYKKNSFINKKKAR